VAALKGIPGLKVNIDSVDQLRATIELLAVREVLVGFPEETAGRELEPGDLPQANDITNAALGYIHDNGMPEQNIPARPFMIPGMNESIPKVTAALLWTAKQVLLRRSGEVIESGFTRAGIAAQFAIRRKINEGVPPPLADSTLRERARRGRKGAKKELSLRAAGEAPSTQFAKPLIDTGQLRNAITYVIRLRKNRSK